MTPLEKIFRSPENQNDIFFVDSASGVIFFLRKQAANTNITDEISQRTGLDLSNPAAFPVMDSVKYLEAKNTAYYEIYGDEYEGVLDDISSVLMYIPTGIDYLLYLIAIGVIVLFIVIIKKKRIRTLY